ncbi:Protein DENND6A [Leucoagaricus sp. SymC.cos]|nr:Protein DENND6A [Leucoagaricus sp. SymC.cos]
MGFAIIEFDLDDGPVVDAVVPPLFLLPSEANNIAFAAFPDSPQFDQGTQCYSFRLREQLSSDYDPKRPATKDGYIYGFSHFTQKRDETSKRGYRQRSVVILTQHQYPALFTSFVSIFGPLFQEHGTPMLEAACHNIATWSDPKPGETLELGFLGTVVHVEIPHTIDQFQLTETSSFNEKYDPKLHVLASCTPFYPPPLLLFEACLSNLWSIWECLVLCEPILVFGPSPTQTSQAIWWLRDLLRPIPLAGDIRPYFTMQDGDHATLVNKLPPKAGLIIGVTNPFFEKSCSHWPHVLSVGKRQPTSSNVKTAGPITGSNGASAGPPPGWKTKTHKRYTSKDHTLLKELEIAARGDDRQKLRASFALRRHFCSRTTDLIAPLARYLNSLIPSPQEVAQARSSKNTLRLKPFSSVSFFASLKANGCTLQFKSSAKRVQFYERWLKSPSFGVWLAHQESIVQDILNTPVNLTATPSLL